MPFDNFPPRNRRSCSTCEAVSLPYRDLFETFDGYLMWTRNAVNAVAQSMSAWKGFLLTTDVAMIAWQNEYLEMAGGASTAL